MNLEGTRFGSITFNQDDIIDFAEGLVGFPHAHRFVVLCTKDDSAFRWLQCIDDPTLAFLVAIPEHLIPEYSPTVSKSQAESLELTPETPTLIFVTANIPKGRPRDMTLNLAGPIVVNGETQKARQLILEDPSYSVKHRVFPANEVAEPVAA